MPVAGSSIVAAAVAIITTQTADHIAAATAAVIMNSPAQIAIRRTSINGSYKTPM